MAKILYEIEYDDQGFRAEQHIVEVGTEPDRVGFVTTSQTIEYLEKKFGKGTRSALERDGRDPFDDSRMGNPYIVPVEGKDPLVFFQVKKPGEQLAFHLTCGHVSTREAHAKFMIWKDLAMPRGREYGREADQKEPSLPWPT